MDAVSARYMSAAAGVQSSYYKPPDQMKRASCLCARSGTPRPARVCALSERLFCATKHVGTEIAVIENPFQVRRKFNFD